MSSADAKKSSNGCEKVQVRRTSVDSKQQQINREAIYDHFEYDKQVPDYHPDSQIGKFYSGRSVFVTGASGFVGKCLVEKLVRSCAEIETVYILMRPKRGLEIEERLRLMLNSELFNKLRNSPEGHKALGKIKAIRGDITLPMFGLSEQDIQLLSSEVSLVFHSAATVKFVEPLRVAVENNVVSVGNLIRLAERLAKLEALVHVSTAYSNCDREEVDELFYKEPIEPEKLIEMANWMDSSLLDEITPNLLAARPNTYTFTKAVAEALLVRKSRQCIPHVPIALVRPSIVAGTWQQPLKGWVDNFNGPTGVILSMVTGALQAMPANSSYCADIVPVDIVANLIISSAYHVAATNEARPQRELELGQEGSTDEHQQQQQLEPMIRMAEKNIRIFNCVSGTLNPIFWTDIVRYVKHINKDFPMNNPLRVPGFILVSNDFLYSIFNFFSHKCVAYFGDFCLGLIGKKQSLVIIYSRLNKMVSTLRPFTTKQWNFKCTNVTKLYDSLSQVDQKIFNFDVRQVDWEDYISRYYIGSKTFALKDDPNVLSTARHTRKRMKTGNLLAQLMLIVLAYYFLISDTPLGHYLWQTIAQMLEGGPLLEDGGNIHSITQWIGIAQQPSV